MKKYDFFVILLEAECGYPLELPHQDSSLELPHQGSSEGYPLSMFHSRNKKNNLYFCKTHFLYKSWV